MIKDEFTVSKRLSFCETSKINLVSYRVDMTGNPSFKKEKISPYLTPNEETVVWIFISNTLEVFLKGVGKLQTEYTFYSIKNIFFK